jgi:hypothetical protein
VSSKLDSYTQASAMGTILVRHSHEQSFIDTIGEKKKRTERRERNLDLIFGGRKKKEDETEPHTTHRWIEFIARTTGRS